MVFSSAHPHFQPPIQFIHIEKISLVFKKYIHTAIWICFLFSKWIKESRTTRKSKSDINTKRKISGSGCKGEKKKQEVIAEKLTIESKHWESFWRGKVKAEGWWQSYKKALKLIFVCSLWDTADKNLRRKYNENSFSSLYKFLSLSVPSKKGPLLAYQKENRKNNRSTTSFFQLIRFCVDF